MTDTHPHDGRLTFLTWIVGLMAAVLMAGIPWAFIVQVDVAKVSVELQALNKNFDRFENPPKWFLENVRILEERVKKLEEKK